MSNSAFNTIGVSGGGSGTITSLTSTGGISLTPSTITTTGVIGTNTELSGLATLSANGLIARTTTGTYVPRTITGTAGNIVVNNGDGVSANPVINLQGTGVTPGSYLAANVTVDSFGRISDISSSAGIKTGSVTVTPAQLFSGGGTFNLTPTPATGVVYVPLWLMVELLYNSIQYTGGGDTSNLTLFWNKTSPAVAGNQSLNLGSFIVCNQASYNVGICSMADPATLVFRANTGVADKSSAAPLAIGLAAIGFDTGNSNIRFTVGYIQTTTS